MTQITRPVSTETAENWTFTGAGSHHESVGEVAASDAELSSTTGDKRLRVGFSPVTNPNTLAGHVLRYRASGKYTARLLAGTTVIAQWEQDDAVLTTHTHTLTAIEAARITAAGYSQLKFEIQGVSGAPFISPIMLMMNEMADG